MSVDCVNLSGKISKYNDLSAVQKELKRIFKDNLDYEDFNFELKKDAETLEFEIYDCYGYYGAVTNFFEKEALSLFPGVNFKYHLKVYWDNGQVEHIRINCDGKDVYYTDEEWTSRDEDEE